MIRHLNGLKQLKGLSKFNLRTQIKQFTLVCSGTRVPRSFMLPMKKVTYT